MVCSLFCDVSSSSMSFCLSEISDVSSTNSSLISALTCGKKQFKGCPGWDLSDFSLFYYLCNFLLYFILYIYFILHILLLVLLLTFGKQNCFRGYSGWGAQQGSFLFSFIFSSLYR
jgi:hypothetical protein